VLIEVLSFKLEGIEASVMEGQESGGKVDRILGCHDVLSSAFLLDHVRELKRKGLLLGEAATASASAAAEVAVAAPVNIAHEKNNVQPIWEDDARPFKDRDVAWILARKNCRKRNMQLLSLDFSAFGQVELLSSEGIQSLLVEGMLESWPGFGCDSRYSVRGT